MTAPTRILLIDDDQVDRATVRRALAKSGLPHELVEAPDGTTGLHIARQEAFDCVLLDYRLPDVDTFELLEQLLSPQGGGQAVLMLTGEDDQEVAFRLMRAGALDYLTKAEATPPSLARAIRYARARRGFLAELETARRDAEEKSRALDTLNRQKTLLFSIIGHDLRNPFQALLGLSEMLGRAVQTRDHASVERRALGIKEAAGQAYRLMESLFAWATVQMDTLTVTLADIDVAEIAGETLRDASDAAADKGITLSAACTGIHARGQRDMLATVLRNLVNNAVKFTLPGGSIDVVAHQVGETVQIAVTDTGVGMAPGRVEDMFRLDRRMTTNGTAGERGSGLGLLICRDLVQRQGGELTVESVLGRGTTFRFTLAAAAAPADLAA